MEQGARRALSAADLSHEIIKAALKVHSVLGPGLLESSYEACLLYELQRAGFKVPSQVPLPLIYGSVKLDTQGTTTLVFAIEQEEFGTSD